MTPPDASNTFTPWRARLITGIGWLLALLISLYVMRYGYRSGISVVAADSWDFVRGFVSHYNDGTLSLVDFFGKRAVGYDHSQPIQRAVLWLHMTLFQMDFGVEAVIGCLFAAAFAACCAYTAMKAVRRGGGGPAATALFLVAFFAATFSLNARSVFDWSLVTLIFPDILGSLLLIVYAHRCLRNEWPLRLFVAAFIACALMDTVAILAIIAIIALLTVVSLSDRGTWRNAWLIASLATAAGAYKVVYALLFPLVPIQSDSLLALTEKAAHMWPESWKALVVPLGGAIVSPSRLGLLFPQLLWPILWAATVIMVALTAWFWTTYFRHRKDGVPFTAAGLMLISYGSVAGVVLMRVPTYGFDYLLQPRYVLFYTLQLVSLLLMASHVWSLNPPKRTRAVITAGILMVIALWGIYAKATAAEARYVRAYNQQLADQIHALWINPQVTPEQCSPNIYMCSWSQEVRQQTTGILQKGLWNVFSPKFRHRHRIRWDDGKHPTP